MGEDGRRHTDGAHEDEDDTARQALPVLVVSAAISAPAASAMTRFLGFPAARAAPRPADCRGV